MAKKKNGVVKKLNGIEKIDPRGRPTMYHPSFNDTALKLCLLGHTNEQLGKSFGVATSTITDWCQKYPAFLASIKGGREVADAKVTAALYHRALGYSHKADKIQLDRNGKWQTKQYIERFPPDPTAAIFWLKNRNPDKWREKLDIETKTITVRTEENGDENNSENDRTG